MLRNCVICGGEFVLPRGKNKTNACSERCRKERQIERDKRWVAENPEKVREKEARWRSRNPEKIRDRDQSRYLKNRDKQLAYHAGHRAAFRLVKEIEAKGLGALL